jgi:hypothetical protein
MDEELYPDRDDALARLANILRDIPRGALITVDVQSVPFTHISNDDDLRLVEEGKPDAFLVAHRDLGSNVNVRLFVYSGR